MFIASLIARPGSGSLDPALCTALRNAWGGGDVVWLAPDEAAEFGVQNVPGNLWTMWQECQTLGIDLAVTAAERRRKRMLLADMDSTLIQQECIDELAAEAGIGTHVADITRRAMNGDLEFEAALTERVALLKGLPERIIETVLATRISYMPGGGTLVATMAAAGAFTMVVSGGFTAFTSQVAAKLGFDAHRANDLVIDKGVLTGRVAQPILGRDAKVATLTAQVARLGLRPSDVISVGDGANDLGMLALAGLGVALHAKPAVQEQCDIRINHGDLTALLYLQGYSRDEFVAPVSGAT